MRRVVVTGIGIVSSIGNNAGEVLTSLREARSGATFAPDYAELGFRCQVRAVPDIDWESLVDRRAARFLAPGTGYAHIAMEQAIAGTKPIPAAPILAQPQGFLGSVRRPPPPPPRTQFGRRGVK